MLLTSFSEFFNLAIKAAGILAFAALVYGGVLYLISTGKPERMSLAKNQISAAFFGLLILLSSYLILVTINPELINLEIPKIQPVQIPEKPDVPLPEITAITSSIDVEMPFARIIEKIFETYISDYPKPKDEKTPRMTRIIDNVDATQEIVDSILEYSTTLKDLADECDCQNTEPDPECGDSGCGGDCYPRPFICTCDPCDNVRSDITENEESNLDEIPKLTQELSKTEEEIRLLKEELDRLKRAEKFISECPLRSLTSWTQFSSKRDSFNNQNWTLRDIKFWDDVNIRYYTSKKTDEHLLDYATFYCSVSGTAEREEIFPTGPDEDKLTGEESMEQAEEVFSESMACPSEAPVGEIIDRTKRTTQLLINKLERIAELDKKLINKINELHIAISECSSKRCVRTCFPVCYGYVDYCIKLGCLGDPCPMDKINKQFDEIKKIKDEIEDIINNEEQGIMYIINELAPEIIKDLANEVRIPMRKCDFLVNCIQAKMAIIPPQNAILRECCQIESKKGQTLYGDCFEQCYLEKGQTKHRKCVQECLNKKAEESNDPELAQCAHELNFYCCSIK